MVLYWLCLKGKLKFALQDATTPPPLVCLTSLTIRLSSILPAVLSALLSMATDEIQTKGFKCIYLKGGNVFIQPITNHLPF